jgi:hypothetical protein
MLENHAAPFTSKLRDVNGGLDYVFDVKGRSKSSAERDTSVKIKLTDGAGAAERGGGTCRDEALVTVAEVRITNPTTAPLTDPAEAGGDNFSGNEFTYDNASPGVLDVYCRVTTDPDTATIQAELTDRIEFAGVVVAGGTVAWSPGDATKGTATYDAGHAYWETVCTVTGLPAAFGDLGLHTTELKVKDPNKDTVFLTEQRAFEIFAMRDERNHPGAGAGTVPNWFFYWNQACGDAHAVYHEVAGNYGVTPAMLYWSPTLAYSKTETWYGDGCTGSDTRRDGSGQTVTGIDLFANTVAHELWHVRQIQDADGVVGALIAPGTIWASGWAWNYGSFNHWLLGLDGQPGVAGVDDDGDVPPRVDERDDASEVGFAGSDDAYQDADGDDLPNASEPGDVEAQAEQHETVPQDSNLASDWCAPGKQHATAAHDD